LKNFAATAGIDVDAALNRLGGDIKLYKKMLSLLSTDLSNFPAQLNTLMDKGDNVSASRSLHTIKGLAAQLGATELSLIAGQGEALLNNSEIPTPDMLNQLLSEIQHKVSATESGIIAIISILSANTPNDLSAIPPSKHPIRPELDRLMLLLQNSDMAALEMMNKLMVTFSQQLNEQLLPLSEAVNQLEFVKAIMLCQTLIDSFFTQQDALI
jgi:HPt (histidine-containing phosphotransfer) domain-containing protein